MVGSSRIQHTHAYTHIYTHLHMDTGTQHSHTHIFTHHTHKEIQQAPCVPRLLVQEGLQEEGLVSSQAPHCGTLVPQRPQYSSQPLGSFLGTGAQSSGKDRQPG